jgi:hypothetical protein
MLTWRGKDGGNATRPDRIAIKRITTNEEEFDKAFDELAVLKSQSKNPLRIYSSVNSRDIKKAQREFKQRQLDADYFDEDSRNQFYLDIKNRWISCLMKQNCREETLFLIDIDEEVTDQDCKVLAREHLKNLGVEIVYEYPTKNGTHIITKPFNPNLFNTNFGEVKKDALLLIDY